MEREVERLEVALEEATVGMEKLSVSERAQREGKQMAQEALRDVQKTAALATAEGEMQSRLCRGGGLIAEKCKLVCAKSGQ